jgi:hypothetical protein
MKPRHRAMQLGDIPECVDMVANHPVLGPRYGSAIEHLPEAWARLLQCEVGHGFVFHVDEALRAPICFFGVDGIVNDDFLQELKTPPYFWFGPELARRIAKGESPLLSGKQLREANSGDGLNLVVWEGFTRPGYETHGELQRYMLTAFVQEYRGYRWKELISSQSASADHLGFVLQTGGYLWDPLAGGYTSTLKSDLSEIVSKPHVVGVTRDLDRMAHENWTVSWVGALFDYHPPKLGFSPSEQSLLTCALRGATDEQLAGILGTSLSAVKKMWISIYRRAENSLPEVIPDSNHSDLPAGGRGREKRRVLLAYVREHPEELRPVSRSSYKNHSKMKLVAP